jgi:GAF domain-containing protein
MNDAMREDRVLQTFARLADTLVAGYDVVDLLQSLVDTCQELLDTTEAGILLADPIGELEVVASTSESGRLVALMQVSAEAGPSAESFRTGTVVSVPDISASPEPWSRFRDGALVLGYASAHAIPMRLRDTTIGTLNLLRDALGELDEHELIAARAFADVATIGILHERSLRESAVLTEQLQTALRSRIVIEQAKGVIAHTLGVPVDEAFALIRGYARSHQLGISRVAAGLVDRSIRLDLADPGTP